MPMDQYREVYRLLSAYEPPKEHTNFCVTYRMSTPVSLAHPWINGDGLIAQVLMRRLLGDTLMSLPSKKPIDISCLKLPLAKTGSCWHCSVSQFNTDQKYVTKIYGRFDAENIGHVKTKKKRIPLMSGHFKSTMVSIPTSLATEVRFYARGSLDECKWLFANVTALGKDRNKGYGAVQSMNIEEVPEDWSLFRDGVVMRPIPVREMPEGWMQPGTQASVMNLTHAPPYWNRAAAVQCVAPGSRLVSPRAEQCWQAVDGLNGGFRGNWFITPHAVERYIQRIRPGITYDQALEDLIAYSGTARRVKEWKLGVDLYRSGRPLRLRLMVGKREDGAPQLLTVYAGHDPGFGPDANR